MPTKKIFLYLIFFLVNLNFGANESISQSNSGAIAGSVTDFKNNALFNVNIIIMDTTIGTASDKSGNYRIEKLSPGEYTLKFMYIGYQPEIRKNVAVKAGQITQLDIKLKEMIISMQEIVVTPGNFSVSQTQTTKKQTIQKQRIASLPATLDDIYRIIQIMPGVSFSDDFSAHFHVRGGKQNENLILLDGMEIFDPYHLKHIGGAIGIINMDLIDNVAIMTGGFPAKYGDKLSSVVAVANRAGKPQKFSGNINAGGTGAALVLEGPILNGSWIFSLRKSFLKEAVKILNPTEITYSPSFYDIQGKIVLAANKNNKVIANFLYSKDDSYLERWRRDSNLYSNYGNSYYGILWKNIHSSALLSELIISRGQNFWDNRVGTEKKEKLSLAENVVNWNLNFQPHRNNNFELGITYKYIVYDYEIVAAELSPDQQNLEELIESYYGNATVSSKSYKIATFLQNKIKIFQPLSANIGIRYDYFEYNKDQQWSPRIGLAYNLTDRTILRAAWGNYYQAPIYTELTDIKGADANPKAEKAIHYILGIEKYLTDDLTIRIEGYVKTLTRMIGHYFEMQQTSTLPILRYGNPNTGQCKGIELFVNGKILPQLSLWLTYAYSVTRIEAYFVNWEKLNVEKKIIPRITDQPHNLSLFLTYQLPKAWELNIKWRYISGKPYTPRYPIWNETSNNPQWKRGEVYSDRYPPYHRLDVRIGKKFNFKNFSLKIFLEIKNLYNHKNVLFYDYEIENEVHLRKAYYALPFLPSIEFNFSF